MIDLCKKQIKLNVSIEYLEALLGVLQKHSKIYSQGEVSKAYDGGVLTTIRSLLGENKEVKQLLKKYGF